MYRNHSVAVVVPAYNEAGFVGDVIRRIPEYVDRIYAVDDGSTDDTWAEIQAAARDVNESTRVETARHPTLDERVVPIRHTRNRGVGGAIKTGYQRARDDRIDVTAVMGGDDQMRPSHIDRFLDPIVEGRAAYTKGNRLLDAETRAGMPGFRKVGNYMLSALTKLASGYWEIGDPQNGYTAISLEALDRIALDEMYEFYGYCNDLLVTLNVHGFRVEDVPRQCNYADEESHIDYRTYIPRVSGMLLRNFLWRLREQYLRGSVHPAALCYTMGMATSVVGTLLAGIEAVSRGRQSRGVANAVWTTVVGGVVFLLGAVFERWHTERLDETGDSAPPTTRESSVSESNARANGEESSPALRTENPRSRAVTGDGDAPPTEAAGSDSPAEP